MTKVMFFTLRFFTEILIAKPKVSILSKIQSLFLFISWAKLQPSVLVHPGLASIFNIMTALHAGNNQNF